MNEFDLIAIGRALLSDPNWANKIKNNQTDKIEQFNKTFVENYY
jgi:2,4-dienoyl-CoA reductase-like NADH-dependent reductase (Old Yellow Enzyme family)